MNYSKHSEITWTEASSTEQKSHFSLSTFFCVCAHTHVESGSLSLFPRPGILKAFARLFLPPSGAKAVMYSSNPARAADNNTHTLYHHELFTLYTSVLGVSVCVFLLLHNCCRCILLFFYFLPAGHAVLLYLACLCPCPSVQQISE